MKKFAALLLGVFFSKTLFLQSQSPALNPVIVAKKTETPISLDGYLTDAAWTAAKSAGNFWQYFPTDSITARFQTEIYLLYDNQYLYVGAKCYTVDKNNVVTSLKRDFLTSGNDNITFEFDTYNDRTNAFFFGINPAGVLREGLISNGGEEMDNFRTEWDDKWAGKAKIFNTYWSVELAIPFKSLRYKQGETKWRFNCFRYEIQGNERSTWAQIPRNQSIFNLAFMGTLKFEKPLPPSRRNISMKPYAKTGISQSFDSSVGGSEPLTQQFGAGLEGKIGITPGLNLDLAVNPDFSQVEVDNQVTDLSRFELFFPEKRQFFLENSDLFGSFGSSRINPFFSRRIGLTQDGSTGNALENPIYFGARLSGKLNNNLRVGLMSVQTAKDKELGLPGYNYTVAAVQHKVQTRSNVGLIFVNKETFSDDSLPVGATRFNRVLGGAYNFSDPSNTWNGKLFFHSMLADKPLPKSPFAHGFELDYRRRRYALQWLHQWVGEDFQPEVGYTPRQNFWRINPEIRWFFYSKNSAFNQHGPGIEYSQEWRPGFGKTDHELDAYWAFEFLNNSMAKVAVRQQYIYLFEPFDPTQSGHRELPAFTGYTFTMAQGEYFSDNSKRFNWSLSPRAGSYFNGKIFGMSGHFGIRTEPYFQLALNYSVDRIDLPGPYVSKTLYLIGPRIDVTFSKSLFWTTFVQFNNQLENVNINSRLQWRFAPVSDIFLVYSENYLPDHFQPKGRSFVLKATYWLNL